jgi:serine/threonine protein kinase
MKPERWQLVNDLFQSATERAPEHREAFLDEACGDDEGLRRELKSLITSHERTQTFIESPAFEVAPELLTNDRAGVRAGELIAHYRIESFIGSGGMGEVYLASDVTAGRHAALKLLPMHFTGDAERLRRFQQESRAVVALNHPNIVTVYEIGEDRSTRYIASELIEGGTLRQRMMRGPLELSEAVDVAIQIASALAAAHAAGIVHRDIKPENIMLRPDGYVKVLDFGIAKLAEPEVAIPRKEALLLNQTNPGSVLGTVRYMSPEQARGTPIGQESDIWSLGAVLYEMVTGHEPFTGNTATEVTTSILEKEPLPLTSHTKQASVELQQIITKSLRKDPTQRYQSAGEMSRGALEGAARAGVFQRLLFFAFLV